MPKAIFEELVRKAAWEDCEVWNDRARSVVKLKRGQALVSVREMAGGDCSYQNLRTIFQMLENQRMIITESNAHGSIVTICNYEEYQSMDDYGNARVTHQLTHDQRTGNAPIDKEREESKEEKNIGTPLRADEISDSKYAFEGKIVRLTWKDFRAWEAAYSNIPNLRAEIQSADDFYDQELQGGDRRRWFHRLSSALAKKDQKYAKDGVISLDQYGRPSGKPRWKRQV